MALLQRCRRAAVIFSHCIATLSEVADDALRQRMHFEPLGAARRARAGAAAVAAQEVGDVLDPGLAITPLPAKIQRDGDDEAGDGAEREASEEGEHGWSVSWVLAVQWLYRAVLATPWLHSRAKQKGQPFRIGLSA